ncbi:hypothetical protein [Pseudomonas sp. PA27(2017)]|uniref:hypothetical protein n=1 Tax=Pseudomonas sp. PA27(2017) TaxID=1932112 RepID=UPI0009641A60|nr:hypothetical protein [Pseudomonas sp. PA27(2017)]OLU26472.1 hypothetical protein BVH06_19225 [Pseudomonas sp. PA27(2017)]
MNDIAAKPIIDGANADANDRSPIALKNKAFAKIYSSRMSREELRESMLAKAKDVVEKGISSIELVTVKEHR